MIFTADKWTGRICLQDLFGRTAPLEVDLGCGKGRFLTSRARAHPEHDFIGTDRQFGRLLKIRNKAGREGFTNARLLHAETAYALEYLLPPASVSACYLFFPDPWPKRRHHRRRLVNARFAGLLAAVLCPGGEFHAATDHRDYFEHIVRVLGADPRFEPAPPYVPTPEERTDFELHFVRLGLPVHRASFRLRPPP